MQSLTQKNSEINYFWHTKNELQVSSIGLHWLLLQQKKKSKCWHQKWKRDNHMIKMSCIKYQYWQIGTRAFLYLYMYI